jgi:tetratricopeptide (TPR) repeat protein
LSKATVIRKKALDCARRQDWPGAIKEYRRLAEIDQSNPNVHNELADIYVRTGQKPEAYDCFVRAIEEYTRVGLYNNAVAVAKKVMRVLPARHEVLTRLGNVRMKQGLAREAESYYLSFLEKVSAATFDESAFKKIAADIRSEMAQSAPALRRLADSLLSFRLNDDAGEVLLHVHSLLTAVGDAASAGDIAKMIDQLGMTSQLQAAQKAAPAGGNGKGDERTVVTEDTIWTKSHTAGERIDIEGTPRFTPPAGNGTAPAPAPAGPSERDQYLLRLARGVGSTIPRDRSDGQTAGAEKEAAGTAEAGNEATPTAEGGTGATPPVAPEPPVVPEPPTPPPAAATEPAPEKRTQATATMDAARPAAAPAGPKPAGSKPVRSPKPAGDHTQISALIDDMDDGEPGEDDYRSHYDLGMAYMEMDLMSEAIREYQLASKSPQFQVKCLEMIGSCFVRQNQPQLAVRQLTKGLGLVDSDSEDSLGMKYNQGLAYEMMGDLDKARLHFEDVYVVDVTFRDVAEKVEKLGRSE